MDERYHVLARQLTRFSVNLQEGDKVLLDAFDVPDEIIIALIRAARAAKALPYVHIHHNRITRELTLVATEEQVSVSAGWELARMRQMDAYISLRGSHNITELSDVPSSQMKLVARRMKAVLDHRVKNTRWCVLRWPTSAMAQQAGMSSEAFEDFYFRVCTLDYRRMAPGMQALKALMDSTDVVELKGPGTDLRFSIKGIGSVMCGGGHNIPDGEVFSCPVRDSVEGVVQYNAPTIYQGVSFDNVRLEFEKGRIVKATSSDTAHLNQILDSDDGARYIGEFSLGFNPHILHPMRDILFDEKISGSFHFTPGQAYEQADNGNKSQVHWDLVCIQRREYGGGEVWFDGKLIRKDGIFLPAPLKKLNPDHLLRADRRPRKAKA